MATKKILVVDDERHIIRLLQVNLERAGYAVITAHDGVEACEKVRTEHPEMVITDTAMPRMNGFDLLKNLQCDQYQNIPVMVLVDAPPGEKDATIFKAWTSGASSVLEKPFDPRAVLVFVDRIFETQ